MKRFFPKGITKTSELLFASYLGKYFLKRGVVVSFKGVSLDVVRGRLHYSKYHSYFKYANDMGYFGDADLGLSEVDGSDVIDSSIYLGDIEADKLPFKVSTMVSGSTTVEVRQYTLLDFAKGDFGVNYDTFDTVVLSLAASLLVRMELGELSKTVLLFDVPDGILELPRHLYNIYNMTFNDAFVRAVVFSVRLRNYELTLGYETWYFNGEDLGYLSERGYTLDEKRNYFNSKYEKGDVVFLYTRTNTGRSIKPRKLVDCRIAVIQDFDERGITLQVLNTGQTKAQKDEEFESLPEKAQAYVGPDSSVRLLTRKYDWLDLGLDYIMSNRDLFEECFITLIEDYEAIETKFYVGDKKKTKVCAKVSYVEAVQYVLEDWNVPFNKKLFSRRHYGGKGLSNRRKYL